MALLFMDGFDAADTAIKWSVGSAANSSSTTRFNTGLSATAGNADLNKIITPSSTIITGFATRTSGTVSPFVISFWGDSGLTQHITLVRDTSTGLIQARRGASNGTLLATGSKSTLNNVWNYYEIKVIISDTVGVVELRIDGSSTPDISFSGDTKNAGTNTTIDRLTYGATTAFPVLYDDVYILNTTGSTNNAFLGDVRINTLVPNGNGNYSQLTGSDGDSTNNYQLVDELPYSATDYTGSATIGLKDSYTLSDVPTGITGVFAVQNNILAAKNDAYVAGARPFIRIAGTDYAGTNHVLNTSYQAYSDMLETNPNTATNWTVSDVNSLEVGMETT